MTYIHPFDDKTRFLVIYQDVSKKPSVISKYTGISQRTISDWISKIERNINIFENQPGQGRKSSVLDALKANIERTVRRDPQKSSTRGLAVQYGVGKTTVNKILKDKGFKFKSVQRTKNFTEEEKDQRVKFCEKMLSVNGKRIHNTFFSDEMGISLEDTYREKVWNPPRKKVKVEVLRKSVRLNCWAAISYNGATSLHIYKGSLDSERYKEILTAHKREMDQLYLRGYYFQHDNLPAHQAAENWILRQNINLVSFPTYSPDLSPIENIWGTLKTAVAKDNPKSESALQKSLIKNWKTLTEVNTLKPYFDNLYHRYQECVEKKGQKLNY